LAGPSAQSAIQELFSGAGLECLLALLSFLIIIIIIVVVPGGRLSAFDSRLAALDCLAWAKPGSVLRV
jgi:hypothetical protein